MRLRQILILPGLAMSGEDLVPKIEARARVREFEVHFGLVVKSAVMLNLSDLQIFSLVVNPLHRTVVENLALIFERDQILAVE